MVNIIGHPLKISERSRPEEGMVTTWSGIQLLKEEGTAALSKKTLVSNATCIRYKSPLIIE